MVHRSRSIFLVLLVIQSIIIVTCATNGKVKECGECVEDSDCAVDRCLKRKCTFNNNKSIIKCFPEVLENINPPKGIPRSRKLGECRRCSRNGDCLSNICFKRKCLISSARSLYKCFPNERRARCSRCTFNFECRSGLKCLDKMCVKKRGQNCSKLRECASCRSSVHCAKGQFCIRNKCTTASTKSLKKCRISFKKKNNCSRCNRNYECKTNRCVQGICKKYFKGDECAAKEECDRCNRDNECKGGKCILNICSNGSITSRLRCGKKKACKKCSEGKDCASNFCFRNICYNDKRSIGKC